jgi:hypothetical protein
MGLLCYQKIRKAEGRTKFWQRRIRISFDKACILGTGFFLFSAYYAVGQESLLDKEISIPKQNTSLYKALNVISQKADVLFIYDSQVVESDKRVKISANNQPLKQVLDNLLANPDLGYKVIGQHILIYKVRRDVDAETIIQPAFTEPDTLKNLVIRGYVSDNENKAAIPYATVGIPEGNTGTVTNADGYFMLKIPASFAGSSLVVSHMGFMSQQIPIQLINEQQVDIFLNRRTISIQEVIIRYIDPDVIIRKAMEKRRENYNLNPAYITSFYREGVQKNSRYISYSEAVFKVYKSSFEHNEYSDQVKLIKSRKIENTNPGDTVFVKLKAGVQSALQLDIVKCIPGFLDLMPPFEYTYTYSDMVSFNSRDAFAITFEQHEELKKALFKGTLYIDKENFAILGADFEINPDYIDLAVDDLVLKKSRKLIVKFEKINYSISYSSFNGIYYLNHARCDIQLKTRFRNRLSADNFNTFLELAACSIDTTNVIKFPKEEVLKPKAVFSDVPCNSDDSFWGDYNRITPEEGINEALSKIIGKIEEIE